jgi:hypothetical protein
MLLSFFRNGDPIERSERVATRGRKLHLNSVKAEDNNGCYTCRAKHYFAGVSTSVGKFPLIIKGKNFLENYKNSTIPTSTFFYIIFYIIYVYRLCLRLINCLIMTKKKWNHSTQNFKIQNFFSTRRVIML